MTYIRHFEEDIWLDEEEEIEEEFWEEEEDWDIIEE